MLNMYRHVSQHDLPLSVQEYQRNRRMMTHPSSHVNVGLRRSRELKVNVFPKRSPTRKDVNDNCYFNTQNSAESVLNRGINNYQYSSRRDDDEEFTENCNQVTNEDNLNNNGLTVPQTCRMQMNIVKENKTTSSEDKGTQTTIVFDVNSTVVAFNNEKFPKKKLSNSKQMQRFLNKYHHFAKDSEKIRKLHHPHSITKLNSRSSLNLFIKPKSSTKMKKSKSSIYINKSNIQYKLCPNCLRNEESINMKNNTLSLLPFLPLVLTSILSAICVVYIIINLFLLPYCTILYHQLTNLGEIKHFNSSHKESRSLFNTIQQFIKRVFGFG